MNDKEAISFLNWSIKQHMNMDNTCEDISKMTTHEREKFNEKREKRLKQYYTLCEEAILTGESSLENLSILNRNGGELYRLTITLDKVPEDEVKTKYPHVVKMIEDVS